MLNQLVAFFDPETFKRQGQRELPTLGQTKEYAFYEKKKTTTTTTMISVRASNVAF